MKLALLFNPGCRVGIGERCAGVLAGFPGVTFECFDVRSAARLRGGFDLYLRLDDGDYSLGGLEHLHPFAWWVADTHLKHSFNNIVTNARAADYLFCFQKDGSERLARLLDRPVYWLPAAGCRRSHCSSAFVCALCAAPSRYCFCGNHRKIQFAQGGAGAYPL